MAIQHGEYKNNKNNKNNKDNKNNNNIKVLTYNPSTGKNEFLKATERTIHTEHGDMYYIETASGHSIKVTDDHSLATCGTADFFTDLPPAESLGALVPITYKIDYEAVCNDFDFVDMMNRLASDDELLELNVSMLSIPADIIAVFMARFMEQFDYAYEPENELDAALISLLLARAGIFYVIEDGIYKADLDCEGYIPQDGVLVERSEARKTNCYRALPYTWSEVIKVEKIEREDITYDFTIPDFPLFIGNAILVYDTMQVHVPISEEARVEALDKMLPSKNLFSVRTLDPMMVPQQESIFGMYKASQRSGEKERLVTTPDKIHEEIEAGLYKPNQPVTYKGHRTTAGLVLLNELLPAEFRDYTSTWDGGTVKKILTKLGKIHPELYTKAADGMKDYGSNFAYLMGVSFSSKDFDLHDLKDKRNTFFNDVTKKMNATDNYEEKVKLLRGAQSYSQKLTDEATSNAFHQWSYSGSKGSKSQVMQIISSPTAVADPRDRIIPTLISKSYNEGLSPADYWVSSYGTRKGTVAAKLNVMPSGMMAKEIVGNVLDIVITEANCGTTEGISLPVKDHKDVLERYEAGSNKLIDSRYLEKLIESGKDHVLVRSPIKCRAKHGICQMCFGYNERGKLPAIGENVGVQAGQAVTEPLTQMGLSSKHTAGTASEDKVGLGTIMKFFTMPNQYSGAAVIAANAGTVTRVEEAPAGGTDIYIGTKKHHVVPGRLISVKVGDVVHPGDILTNGVPNIAKIVPHKGIDAGRELFVNHASDLYARAGASAVKKNFETVARGIVNYVRVDDPGDFEDMVEGDILDYNKIRAEILEHPTKKAPKLSPVQSGTTRSPQEKPDWLANFGFKYLKQNLIENAATGVKSDIHSYHPVPGYAVGTEFGTGANGRY